MNTVSVDKSLLTRVTQYVADRVFDFQQAETAPDGSIEIEAQEIIDSELKLLSELQAALTQPEQPAAGRDEAREIAKAVANLMFRKEGSDPFAGGLVVDHLEAVIRPFIRPQVQEA